jgi:hypothetical protein
MQWLPLQFVTPNELRAIVATQLRVFPWTFAVRSGASDVMLLGFRREAAPRIPLGWLDQRLQVLAQEPRFRGRRWSPACEHEALSVEGVLSLVLAGPEALATLKSEPYRDDVPLLSYGSGDRWLSWRYEGTPLARLSFNALPLSPYVKLARYFPGRLPLLELESERARVLELFRVASPVEIALAETGFRRALPGENKARAALRVASLHDRGGAKAASLSWLLVSLREAPGFGPPPFLARVHRIAEQRIAVEHPRIRAFLQSLRPEQRETPLARAVADELRLHEEREAERRSGYLFH